MADFFDKLCSVERDRVTAAEICIDECLTIMDRHSANQRSPLYSSLRNISQALNTMLRDADGMNARYERLIRVRAALTTAFPMTDEDLEGTASPQDTKND